MENRVLFMIIGDEVKYLAGSKMDHREWYVSLGYDQSNFDNIIRGYVLENKILFFKGMNFNYDQEVINAARRFSPSIRITLNNPNLEVYCGIIVNGYGQKWEPVLKINEDEITGIVPEPPKKEKKEVGHVETGPIIEFKNNYEDPKFIKKATIVTGIVMVIVFIIKIVLFSKQEILQTSNRADILLSFLQIASLGATIYGYQKKLSYAKYLGVVASVLIILTLDVLDIIIGILYFLFNIDQNYFTNIINLIKGKKRG